MPLDAAAGVGTRRENVVSWLRDLAARSSALGEDGSSSGSG
jgi:hypothetical protein